MVDRTTRPVVPTTHPDEKEHRRLLAVRASAALPKDGSEGMTHPLKLKSFTAAELTGDYAASLWEGAAVFVSDEDTVAVSDGTNWIRLDDVAGDLAVDTLVIGHTALLSTFTDSALTPPLQVLGAVSGLGVARFSNDALPARLLLAKSRGTTVGSYTAVSTNDLLGAIRFEGADGTDFETYGEVRGLVVDATGGSEDFRFNFQGYQAGSIVTFLSADGDGIKFNGDTAVTNALNDYEEGTWVPTYTTNGVNFTSVTYDVDFDQGRYTKIGNLVHIQFRLRTDALTIGAATGGVMVSGLPFTAVANSASSSDGYSSVSICISSAFVTAAPRACVVVQNSDDIELFTVAADGTATALPPANMNTGTNDNEVLISGTYIAA